MKVQAASFERAVRDCSVIDRQHSFGRKTRLYESFLTNHFFLLTSTNLGEVPRGQQLTWTRSSPWDSQGCSKMHTLVPHCGCGNSSALNTGQSVLPPELLAATWH